MSQVIRAFFSTHTWLVFFGTKASHISNFVCRRIILRQDWGEVFDAQNQIEIKVVCSYVYRSTIEECGRRELGMAISHLIFWGTPFSDKAIRVNFLLGRIEFNWSSRAPEEVWWLHTFLVDIWLVIFQSLLVGDLTRWSCWGSTPIRSGTIWNSQPCSWIIWVHPQNTIHVAMEIPYQRRFFMGNHGKPIYKWGISHCHIWLPEGRWNPRMTKSEICLAVSSLFPQDHGPASIHVPCWGAGT